MGIGFDGMEDTDWKEELIADEEAPLSSIGKS